MITDHKQRSRNPANKLRHDAGGFIGVNLQLAGNLIGVKKSQTGRFEVGVEEGRFPGAIRSSQGYEDRTPSEDAIPLAQGVRRDPGWLGPAASFHFCGNPTR